MEILKEISKLLLEIRDQRPLVHHITNLVTMNDCANAVLALGGSPIMAFDPSEVGEVVSHASSLVLNIGTLNQMNVKSMFIAARMANKLNIPIILDPVGISVSGFRYDMVCKLLADVKLSVIKGNLAEIKVLSGLITRTKGIDSNEEALSDTVIASNLARKHNCVVAITGKTDLVSNGKETYAIANGHSYLSRITGTGCMVTSLIGTYCGVTEDYLLGTLGGILAMGLAGEKAYQSLGETERVGTFKVRLFDSLYSLSSDTFIKDGDLVVG